MEHRLYYWKISCIIGRPIVVLEDRLCYWKSTVLLEDLLRCWKMNGRSKVLLENQLYWRQSTGLDGNYRSRKITARRWLHKYVGAECGASSFTWYLYRMSNTDVRPPVRLSVCRSVDRIVSALYLQQYSSDPFHICASYQATSEGMSRVMFITKFKNLKFWQIL